MDGFALLFSIKLSMPFDSSSPAKACKVNPCCLRNCLMRSPKVVITSPAFYVYVEFVSFTDDASLQ